MAAASSSSGRPLAPSRRSRRPAPRSVPPAPPTAAGPSAWSASADRSPREQRRVGRRREPGAATTQRPESDAIEEEVDDGRRVEREQLAHDEPADDRDPERLP